MKMIVFSVRDRALNGFMRPFVAPAVGIAVRSFADEVNKQDSPMFAHPDDYDLYELGTFDEETGLIVPRETPRQVAIGKEHKRPQDA